jgi:hypothetical protein
VTEVEHSRSSSTTRWGLRSHPDEEAGQFLGTLEKRKQGVAGAITRVPTPCPGKQVFSDWAVTGALVGYHRGAARWLRATS